MQAGGRDADFNCCSDTLEQTVARVRGLGFDLKRTGRGIGEGRNIANHCLNLLARSKLNIGDLPNGKLGDLLLAGAGRDQQRIHGGNGNHRVTSADKAAHLSDPVLHQSGNGGAHFKVTDLVPGLLHGCECGFISRFQIRECVSGYETLFNKCAGRIEVDLSGDKRLLSLPQILVAGIGADQGYDITQSDNVALVDKDL